MTEHRKVYIRKTHPGLYHSLMILSVTSIALAINFWTSTPTFNPLDIPKNIIGVIFFILGLGQMIFLNVYRDLKLVQITLATCLGFYFFWGAINTIQSFAGKASFQLPILYLALSILYVPLLIEAPVNPVTEKEQ